MVVPFGFCASDSSYVIRHTVLRDHIARAHSTATIFKISQILECFYTKQMVFHLSGLPSVCVFSALGKLLHEWQMTMMPVVGIAPMSYIISANMLKMNNRRTCVNIGCAIVERHCMAWRWKKLKRKMNCTVPLEQFWYADWEFEWKP